MIKSLFKSFIREGRYLRKHPWDLSLVVIIPIVMIAFSAWVFSAETVRHLPIVLVDEDGSAMSRRLEQLLEISPGSSVVMKTNNMAEAQSAMRRLDAYGILFVPDGAECDAMRGAQAKLYFFFNDSFYTPGNLVARDVQSVVSELGATLIPSALGANRVVDTRSAHEAPIGVQITALFNSSSNYEWALGMVLTPALLHLVFCCAFVVAVGREVAPSRRNSWIVHGGSLGGALAYKIIFYAGIFTLFGALALFWAHFGRGIPINGSLWLILLGQFMMYVAYGSMLSLVLGLSKGSLLQALSFTSMFTGAAFTFGNALFPFNEVTSLFVRFVSTILPFTHYMRVQTEQMYMGTPIVYSLHGIAYLGLFTVVLFPLAIWAVREAMPFNPRHEVS